jgi:chorismate synthase
VSNTYGKNVKITIFGQSHSPAIGVTVDGLPAGFAVDFDELNAFMRRRAPGQGEHTTARKEADAPEFLSGLVDGVTCGAPLTAIIRNTDTRSQDYEQLKDIPRPSHADYTAYVKYGEARDVRGGGQFSGRLTAPLCVAGGICLQLLRREGIIITARIVQMGNIEEAKQTGDSVGGIIECAMEGVPAGLGEPMFGGMENRLASILFGIPAVKGVEFGNGFAAAGLRGSENNDAFIMDGDIIKTRTNNHGGILGGITSGMPIVFRVAFKPTPSIAVEQDSISLSRREGVKLSVIGRHDPCIVPRAVPCVEAAAAVAIYDALIEDRRKF